MNLNTHIYQPLLLRFVRFLRPSNNGLLLILAVMVGVATALALWIFRLMIEYAHAFFQEFLAETVFHGLGVFNMVVALLLAGLIVGLIRHRFIGAERYHGVAGIIEAVALSGGRLKYQTMPYKTLASSISLGAGGSVGPEDPSVQIGANIGSMFGQRLRLKEDQKRLLVSAGAASAISAAFNAPIAGVFFALEVILHGELATASVSVVILAAVISAAVTQGLDIGEAAMGPFDFSLNSALEIPFYVPLGILLAPIAAAFIRMAYWQYDLWHHLKIPDALRTALAGALVGLVAIFFPQIMGIGRDVMNEVFAGEFDATIMFLMALGFAKLVMTALSLAAGFVGGIFAPSLFIGTMFGAAYGDIVSRLFGGVVGDPRSYAIAGMAGMMAGVVRAPITAIMLVFELTNNYRFILPIMLITVVCIFVAERIERYGVYELGLVRNGIKLSHGRDIDIMQGITVAEAMFTPAPTIHENATLADLRAALREYHRHALCVVDDTGQLTGVVTLSDLQNAYAASGGNIEMTVGEICTRQVITAESDDILWTAIRNMGAHNVGRLPVLDSKTRQLVGMVNRQDMVDAYNDAIARKIRDQQFAEQIRLNTLTGGHVYEMHIKPNTALDGVHICDVPWPPETVVASIQRRGKMVVPHGHTELKSGDILMVVADPHSEMKLIHLFMARDFNPQPDMQSRHL